MSISVSSYGTNKPGPGVIPIRTGPPPAIPKLPFGQRGGINWQTGKHIPLVKPVVTENEAVEASAPAITTLRGLSDTSVDNAQPDDVLIYNGSAWVPGEAGQASVASPGTVVTTIGAASEGDEDASADTWVAGGGTGLAEWYVSRLVYDDTGDEVLYAFLRKRTYDSAGRLYSVSAETRITVDTPVAES